MVGIPDSEKKTLDIWTSRIMDFSQGVDQDREAWLTVLGWMMGTAVGVTA